MLSFQNTQFLSLWGVHGFTHSLYITELVAKVEIEWKKFVVLIIYEFQDAKNILHPIFTPIQFLGGGGKIFLCLEIVTGNLSY